MHIVNMFQDKYRVCNFYVIITNKLFYI